MTVQKIDARANWASINPILLPGEIGFESDTGYEKVGNGKTEWNKLHYYGSSGHWGEFSSDATQTALADTPTAITFNDINNDGDGVRLVDESEILVELPGIYVFEINLQVSNNDTQIHDAHFWLRKNNNDSSGNLPLTANTVSVTEKHGGVPGGNNLLIDHTLKLQADDYIEIMWAPTNANLSLRSGPAITSPYARPSTPSVVCNVFQVAAA